MHQSGSPLHVAQGKVQFKQAPSFKYIPGRHVAQEVELGPLQVAQDESQGVQRPQFV